MQLAAHAVTASVATGDVLWEDAVGDPSRMNLGIMVGLRRWDERAASFPVGNTCYLTMTRFGRCWTFVSVSFVYVLVDQSLLTFFPTTCP
jgi:hypothetical protein